MKRWPELPRRAVVAGATLALVTATVGMLAEVRPAQAGDKEDCVAASDAAQNLRGEKKLLAARKQLLQCVREVCPGPVKADCGIWLAEVEKSTPTIVISATDDKGDLSTVQVFVDGQLLADKLEGAAIPIDPGAHAFRYVGPDGKTKEASIVIKEGEKNRRLDVSFATAAVIEKPVLASPRPVPTVTYVLGAVAVVGFADWAFFGLTGKHDVQKLRDTCAPACDKSDENAAKKKLIVADIGLGVGLVSLGLASYFYFSRSSAEAPPAPTTALRIDAIPLAGGGAIGLLGGAF